jgi:hypothetical protein
MNNKPSLAYQRKRPRFKSNKPVGMQKPTNGPPGGASDNMDDEEHETPTTMEARTQEAEAAYHFADQDASDATPPANPTSPQPQQEQKHSREPRDQKDQKEPKDPKENREPREPKDPAATAATEGAEGNPDANSTDPAAIRREQERMRREQERERRDNERKERERRDNERRDQQKREQERRERERIQELRSLDVDSICNKAWDIYSAEVKEEGVELFPDNDARELCKRSFRLAEIFLLEEARLRRLRNEPMTEPAPESAAPAASEEPTMGE